MNKNQFKEKLKKGFENNLNKVYILNEKGEINLPKEIIKRLNTSIYKNIWKAINEKRIVFCDNVEVSSFYEYINGHEENTSRVLYRSIFNVTQILKTTYSLTGTEMRNKGDKEFDVLINKMVDAIDSHFKDMEMVLLYGQIKVRIGENGHPIRSADGIEELSKKNDIDMVKCLNNFKLVFLRGRQPAIITNCQAPMVDARIDSILSEFSIII